jgi:hypothetical protein
MLHCSTYLSWIVLLSDAAQRWAAFAAYEEEISSGAGFARNDEPWQRLANSIVAVVLCGGSGATQLQALHQHTMHLAVHYHT